MYSDQTLTPKEALRLCALGTLGSKPLTYAALAKSVRHFIDRIQGPMIDVLGTSIELLKYEELIESVNAEDQVDVLTLTEKGQAELISLLTADMKPNDSDLNKLIESLKFRFMHLLTSQQKLEQTQLLIEHISIEILRLSDLLKYYESDNEFFLNWLERDIKEKENRLKWLNGFQERLTNSY